MKKYLYNSDTVKVGRKRITIRGMEYPVRNLSAVGIEKNESPKKEPMLYYLISATLAFVAFLVWVHRSQSGTSSGLETLLGGCIMGAVIVFLLGIQARRRLPTFYNLMFETNSGRTQVYNTTDEKEINAIRDAINEAIDTQSDREPPETEREEKKGETVE